MSQIETYKPMSLSDQYQASAANPPQDRKGIVAAFNSAFKPDGAQGSHWSTRQYKPTGKDFNSRLAEVTDRDQEQIRKIQENLSRKTDRDTISILDFGAGNGRLSGLYEQLGKDLTTSKKKLQVIALDTSREALNQFAIRLKDSGFAAIENTSRQARDLETNDPGYLYDVFQKDNITIKLLHGNIDNSPEEVKKLVLQNNDNQKLSLTFGFDSLPFIEDSKNRSAFLKMFREITDADLLFTVPGVNVEKWQPLRYEFEQRRKDGNPAAIGLAKEPNSLVYNFRAHHLFYQLFDRAQLAADAVQAGLKNFEIRINQFWHPQRHQENEGLAKLDKERTFRENERLDSHGHTAEMDQIFRTVDGFIQLHDKGN